MTRYRKRRRRYNKKRRIIHRIMCFVLFFMVILWLRADSATVINQSKARIQLAQTLLEQEISSSDTITVDDRTVDELLQLGDKNPFLNVFHLSFYYNKYSDLRETFGWNEHALFKHFLNHGMEEGRQASEEFNPTTYKNKYQNIRITYQQNIKMYYADYILHGKEDGKTATGTAPIIDPITIYKGIDYSSVYDYYDYIKQYPDLASMYPQDDISVLREFVEEGMAQGRIAKESFNVYAYLAQNPDLRKAYRTNLPAYYLHYIAQGRAENRPATGSTQLVNPVTVYNGVDYAPVYNFDYYMQNNPSLMAQYQFDDEGALEYFVNTGMKSGAQASTEFNYLAYKANYQTIRDTYKDDTASYYMHYIQYGKNEGRNAATFNPIISKKGIQGTDFLSDGNLNVKHVLINIDLGQWLSNPSPNISYTYNGKTYYYNAGMDGIDEAVRQANARGITVTFVLLVPWMDAHQDYIYAGARDGGGHLFYEMDAQDQNARDAWTALFEYLGTRYSQADCHVDNWILGNEANVPNKYNYTGSLDTDTNVTAYAQSYLLLLNALRTTNPAAKTYISIDHTWDYNDMGRQISGRDFISAFDTKLHQLQADATWNLAYHLYAPIMSSARFWAAQYLKYTPNNVSAMFVSPYNMDVLTEYIKTHYGTNCRILLSEQGFDSSEGNQYQAAALAYTFYLAQENDMIDAVIFRAYQDDPNDDGFLFGLKDANGVKRESYDVFCNMDRANGTDYTNPYLSVIGASRWEDIVPGYVYNPNWQ